MIQFFVDACRAMFSGSRSYWLWLLLLAAVIGVGCASYAQQLQHGLVVTGLSDQVSWGFYISNFAFLVGIAAAAVLYYVESIDGGRDRGRLLDLATLAPVDGTAGNM